MRCSVQHNQLAVVHVHGSAQLGLERQPNCRDAAELPENFLNASSVSYRDMGSSRIAYCPQILIDKPADLDLDESLEHVFHAHLIIRNVRRSAVANLSERCGVENISPQKHLHIQRYSII